MHKNHPTQFFFRISFYQNSPPWKIKLQITMQNPSTNHRVSSFDWLLLPEVFLLVGIYCSQTGFFTYKASYLLENCLFLTPWTMSSVDTMTASRPYLSCPPWAWKQRSMVMFGCCMPWHRLGGTKAAMDDGSCHGWGIWWLILLVFCVSFYAGIIVEVAEIAYS